MYNRLTDYCSMCGQYVPLKDDVTFLHSIRLSDPYLMAGLPARHLFPIVKNQTIICAGYPATMQYLNGYTTAKVFFFEPVTMLRYRAAYREMQRQAKLLETALQQS